ncbi:MAG: hypothetical protein J6M10_03725 [Clostridia bacterium]|nr:hypothetical protein [Clostridia bacterium]
MADILTKAQLQEQLARRQETLRKMQAEGAPESSLHAQRKKIELTERRLERMENADYEESIESVLRIGG